MSDYSKHVALDLFAGVGFGVAVRNLGAKEYGVDNAKSVIATRAANGLETAYEDVWDIEKARGLVFDTLLSGAPCPTFSAAGNGSGRRQMPLILQAIEDGIWKDMGELRAWADMLEDERTGLVLTPLAYAWEFRPDYIVQEQVPQVLPVWEAYRAPLEEMGYSVYVAVFNAEQYGVPQTRRRAILMARKRELGEVRPPVPTHSRYYERDRKRLDPGVLPWVSMAEGLAPISATPRPTNRPAPTVTGGGVRTGGWEPFGTGGRKAILHSLSLATTQTDQRESEAAA